MSVKWTGVQSWATVPLCGSSESWLVSAEVGNDMVPRQQPWGRRALIRGRQRDARSILGRAWEAARESLKSYQRVIETAVGNPGKGKGRASQSVGPKQCMRKKIKLADWGMHEKKEEINRLENKICHRWEGCVFFGKYVFKEVDYEG